MLSLFFIITLFTARNNILFNTNPPIFFVKIGSYIAFPNVCRLLCTLFGVVVNSMSSLSFLFMGENCGVVGAVSCPCSTDAVTSSVVMVGSDLMEAVSRLVGEVSLDLAEGCRRDDFFR